MTRADSILPRNFVDDTAQRRECASVKTDRSSTGSRSGCLYTTHRGQVYRGDIHHQPWPLQDAEAELETNTVAPAAGILLPKTAPLLHFARRLDVLIWPLRRAE